jgi:hypothetical protein
MSMRLRTEQIESRDKDGRVQYVIERWDFDGEPSLLVFCSPINRHPLLQMPLDSLPQLICDLQFLVQPHFPNEPESKTHREQSCPAAPETGAA